MTKKKDRAIIEIKNKLQLGDTLELIEPYKLEPYVFKIEKLWDADTGEEIKEVSPGVKGQKVILNMPEKCEKDWIIRRGK